MALGTVKWAFDQIETIFTTGAVYRIQGKQTITVAHTVAQRASVGELNGVSYVSVASNPRGGTVTIECIFHNTLGRLMNEVWLPAQNPPNIITTGKLTVPDVHGSGILVSMTSAVLTGFAGGPAQAGETPQIWTLTFSGIINHLSLQQNVSPFGPFPTGQI